LIFVQVLTVGLLVGYWRAFHDANLISFRL